MDPLVFIAWSMLVVSSILALAEFIAATHRAWAYRRSKAAFLHTNASRCLAAIEKLAQSLPRLSRDQIQGDLRHIKERVSLSSESDGLAAVLEYLLENTPHHLTDIDAVANGAHGVILAQQRRLERGGQRLCGYLVKLGPWAGLTGTLAGVRESLAAFVRSMGAVQEFAAGFATAIDTTIWGILIAVLAYSTSRGIWAPLVEAQHAELAEQGMTALTHLKRIYSNLSDGGGAPTSSPKQGGPLPGTQTPSPSPASAIDAATLMNGGQPCLTNAIQ